MMKLTEKHIEDIESLGYDIEGETEERIGELLTELFYVTAELDNGIGAIGGASVQLDDSYHVGEFPTEEELEELHEEILRQAKRRYGRSSNHYILNVYMNGIV